MGRGTADRAPDGLTYAVAAETFIGRRPENQDCCDAWRGEGWALLALADGMGGAAGGAIASEKAIGALAELRGWLEHNSQPPSEALYARLESAFATANDDIYQLAQSNPKLSGMGTTLVIAVVTAGRLFVAHAGDSRAYLVDKDSVSLLTRDHNIAHDRADLWDGEDPVYGRSLTRSVGDTAEVVPTFHPPRQGASCADTVTGLVLAAEDAKDGPDTHDHLLHEGHVVLLCSDGVHGCLSEDDLKACVFGAATGAAAARLLIKRAYEGGSTDNASVSLVEVGRVPRQGKLIRHVDLPAPDGQRPLRKFAGGRGTKWALCLGTVVLSVLSCCAMLLLWSSVQEQRRRQGQSPSLAQATSKDVLQMLFSDAASKGVLGDLPQLDQAHHAECPEGCEHREYCDFVRHLMAAARLEAESRRGSPELTEHLNLARALISAISQRAVKRAFSVRNTPNLPSQEIVNRPKE